MVMAPGTARMRRQAKRTGPASAAEAPRVLEARLPAYAAPLFDPWRYKVLYGGRGAARSWTVARSLLIKASERKLRVLCTRELQTSIKDSVHKLLQDQIELMGLKGFTVTHTEIRHDNGSLFLFEGLRHNVTKIKSLEGIDICWVEEAERITKESWAVLIPTIRKEGSEIWVTFNPDQEDDATYKRFVLNPPPNAWVKEVSWEDNPWFPEVLREEKDYDYKLDPESAEHIWGGKTRQVTDAQILRRKWIVEEFTVPVAHTSADDCEHLRDGVECHHYLWNGPYQGLDFGFANDPVAAMRLWIYDASLYVEHELFKVHLDIDHINATVNEAIPRWSDYVTRADSARPDSISYLRRHGMPRIVGVKKRPGSVEDGVAHLRSYKQIVVHPRCKHFKEECKHYSYKVDERSGDVLPEIVDAHNHGMDASRYALEPLIKFRGGNMRLLGQVNAAPRVAVEEVDLEVGTLMAESEQGNKEALALTTRRLSASLNGNGRH